MAKVRTEVAGNVWKVEVVVGQMVAAGDVLVIIESMKMELPVEAPASGIVAAIGVAVGDPVAEGAFIAEVG
jgi:acetyl-CoA carboxylase biotin carboxyl carrier protein